MSHTHDAASVFGFDIKYTGLLQLSACRTTVINSHTTAECPERCSSTRSGSATTWSRQFGTERAPLVASALQNQAGSADVQSTRWPVSIIHQRCRTPVSTICALATHHYVVPRTRTKFRERAICVTRPTVLNCLPESLRISRLHFEFQTALTF